MRPSTTTKGTGPLGADNPVKSQSFYTAVRDFDQALRTPLAATPRQILAQGKDIMRRFDAIITACAAGSVTEKGPYFQQLKIRVQNAKTRAIGPLLRAAESPMQTESSRTRLLSMLGTFDIHAVEAPMQDMRWLDAEEANRQVALYRLDEMLNAGLIGPAYFHNSTPAQEGVMGLIQKPAPALDNAFDILFATDDPAQNARIRALRQANQRQIIDALLGSGDAIANLPDHADAALGFNLLALDGEMLTLAMDDLLDMQALGALSQQLIDIHAYLLHRELEGSLYNPLQWQIAAQNG